jgi:hypothetical protein
MYNGRLITLALFAALDTACASSGPPDCSTRTSSLVSTAASSQKGTSGFSVDDAMSPFWNYQATATWQPAPTSNGVQYVPSDGQTTIRLSFRYAGAKVMDTQIVNVDPSRVLGDSCVAHLSTNLEAQIATDDGGLVATTGADLTAYGRGELTIVARFTGKDVGGFKVTEAPVETPPQMSATLRVKSGVARGWFAGSWISTPSEDVGGSQTGAGTGFTALMWGE